MNVCGQFFISIINCHRDTEREIIKGKIKQCYDKYLTRYSISTRIRTQYRNLRIFMRIDKLDKHPKHWLILTIFWMVVIFILSTSPFSSQRTSEITDKISVKINFRLIAHLIVYFILGFLASGAIRSNFNWDKKVVFTVLICFLYGISDEVHQYFEPVRKCRLIDMITDGGGSLLGILTYYLGYLRLKKRAVNCKY